MKQLMVDNNTAASHSFLLDDDSSIPFSLDDVAGLMDDKVRFWSPLSVCVCVCEGGGGLLAGRRGQGARACACVCGRADVFACGTSRSQRFERTLAQPLLPRNWRQEPYGE